MKWAKAQAYYTGDNPFDLAKHALPRLKGSECYFKALSYINVSDNIYILQNFEIQT